MTSKESTVLNELIHECWEKAQDAVKADEKIEAVQYLKAHLYLIKYSNAVKKQKGGASSED